MRKLIFVIFLVFMLPSSVFSQDNKQYLFSDVNVDRVVALTLVEGMGDNERVLYGTDAQYVVKQAQAYLATSVPYVPVHPFSWDFAANQPQDNFTPLVFMLAVREDWLQDGRLYQQYNTLACYDIGKPDVYGCWDVDGTGEDILMGWHHNELEIEQNVIHTMITEFIY